MLPLIKKDFLLNNWLAYLGISLFLFVTYFVTLPPTFIFIISFFALAFSVFSYDDKKTVNRFLVSLPINRKVIIYSRYFYCIFIILFILLIQSGIMLLLSPIYAKTHYIYGWKDIVVLFCIGCLIIAVIIPIITAFRKINYALIIIFAFFGAGTTFLINELVIVLHMKNEINFNALNPGFALLAEKYMPFSTYLTLPIITGIVVYFSMIISRRIFNNKEF